MKQLPTLPLAAALLLSTAATASAQTTFHLGLRGGLNRALTTVAPESNFSSVTFTESSADKSSIFAWQAGVVAEARFGRFAVQPGLLFSQKGERFNTSYLREGISVNQREATSRYNWLEVPVNFVYTLHGDHGLQIFAGPYVALGVGGRQRGNSLTYPLITNIQLPVYPTDFDAPLHYGSGTPNQRLDAGLNFGIGYRQGPVQVQLGYGLGLRNLHQSVPSADIDPGFSPGYHNFNSDAAYNRVAQLTGTYFFSL